MQEELELKAYTSTTDQKSPATAAHQNATEGLASGATSPTSEVVQAPSRRGSGFVAKSPPSSLTSSPVQAKTPSYVFSEGVAPASPEAHAQLPSQQLGTKKAKKTRSSKLGDSNCAQSVYYQSPFRKDQLRVLPLSLFLLLVILPSRELTIPSRSTDQEYNAQADIYPAFTTAPCGRTVFPPGTVDVYANGLYELNYADPFGPNASMSFPTPFSYDQIHVRP